jgi:hypothetical protein
MTRKELKKRGDERKLKASAKSDAVPDIGKSAGTIEQESGRGEAEREGGDDDSDAEGDDDATRDKSKNNRQQAGYEAHEDEEENILAARAQERDATPEADDSSEDETYGGSPRSSPGAESGKSSKSLAKDRENRIRGGKNTNDVVSFSFDDKTGASCSFTMEYDANTAKVLMLHLVEVCARQALVQSVPGLATCTVDEETSAKTGIARVITAGVNLQAMWDYQHIIHPHYIYTNSIGHILTHYGVEAARGGIVRELQGVFGGHGISVDPRHLTLIADYMTRDGAYQAFNRMGYRGNTSPFMKMSFETTLAFLRDAVQEGDVDDLTNPSARIVAGRVGRMGTGGFDVLMPLNDAEDADGDGDVEMEG